MILKIILKGVSIKARFHVRDDTIDNLKGVSIKDRFLAKDDTEDALKRGQYQGQVPCQG